MLPFVIALFGTSIEADMVQYFVFMVLFYKKFFVTQKQFIFDAIYCKYRIAS